MQYRNATFKDIPAVSELQQKYHISTVSEEDKPDGFVTTLFTEKQFKEIIEKENGLFIALDGDRVVGYAMAASWEYWSQWPMFQHMIKDLPNTQFQGEQLTLDNSYQYGPITVHKDYRGSKTFPNLFEYSRREMNKRYPILITFINHINPRSLRAHEKLGVEVIKSFEYNNNNYYELGYDTARKADGSDI